VSSNSIDRINAAVRACLDRCYGSESPIAELGLFLDEKRHAGELNDSEASQVRTTVSRILGHIAGDYE
jgi:hypothetical protein